MGAGIRPASSSGLRSFWRPHAGLDDDAIGRAVGTCGSTVYRTKRRFVEKSLDAALSEEPRPGAERKLTGKPEVLVATACSTPPPGCAR